ncbi:RNA methyltransferase [Proteinivorax hydrogeniformans]|uniref:RNA methyltransferase n=1 Tax=Proteinivorax hydrogeniformans TaxID=1826727 RepID=A0AAU8HSD4_9FIRM
MISSKDNPLIKKILLNKKKGKKSKENFYLAEGERFVHEIAEKTPNLIEKLLLQDGMIKKYEKLLNSFSNDKIITISDNLFNTISSTDTTQGIAALVQRPDFKIEDLSKGNYIVIDRVQDPGNLGTIIRTAVASGVDGMLLLKGTVDIFNDKVLRATMGALHNIPIVYDLDLNDLKEFISNRELTLIKSDLEGEYWGDVDLPNRNYCLVVGNEANGISTSVQKMPGVSVKLPIYGEIESLNVAVAAGIMLYKLQSS